MGCEWLRLGFRFDMVVLLMFRDGGTLSVVKVLMTASRV